jgi:hypothetical protein
LHVIGISRRFRDHTRIRFDMTRGAFAVFGCILASLGIAPLRLGRLHPTKPAAKCNKIAQEIISVVESAKFEFGLNCAWLL